MSISTEYIENLVFKFNNGTISTEELQILTDWYNNHDDQNAIITSPSEEVKSRMLAGLLVKVANKPPKVFKIGSKWQWMTASVAVLALAFTTLMIIQKPSPSPKIAQTQSSIEPGGNKATLTLANGKSIALSNKQSGIVAGSEIRYIDGSIIENTSLDTIQQLALHTPRGGTYTVKLQDGTEVWLNAQSTLKYPSSFNSTERVVELDGEAYFAVKTIYQKDGTKIPFKVVTKQQVVEVLGTKFNISSYADQVWNKTTLVEGKVAISDKYNRLLLLPNDQAVTTNGKTKIKKVDVASYTAWREGKFNFDNKTFEETMSEICRWYDLDIKYENGIPTEELTGDAFRNDNIRLVLRLLDVAQINYKLDVRLRKLTIKGKKNKT